MVRRELRHRPSGAASMTDCQAALSASDGFDVLTGLAFVGILARKHMRSRGT
jgi:hypothetical protein